MSLEMADNYKQIAERIIDRYQVAFAHIDLSKVLFLNETQRAPKKFADIKKVVPPYDFMTDYKFIITFYEANMISLNDAQRNMVVYHELFHIDNNFENLKKHDIQDFLEVLMIGGLQWTVNPNITDVLAGPVEEPTITEEDDEEPELI